MKIAVTGILACGKSLACQLFKEFGARVVSADEIVHNLLEEERELTEKIVQLLGDDLLVDGRLSRKSLAEKVFSNPEQLHLLEKLIHPLVKKEIEREAEEFAKQQPEGLFVAEIPLLFEKKELFDGTFYDKTLAVISDEKLCRQRFQKATGYDDTEFNKRMMNQLNQEEKAQQADLIIPNNGSISDLREAIQTTLSLITQM